VRIEPRPFDDPEAVALRAELAADVVVRYGYDDEPGVKPSAGYMRCPCWGAYAEAHDSVCFERAPR